MAGVDLKIEVVILADIEVSTTSGLGWNWIDQIRAVGNGVWGRLD